MPSPRGGFGDDGWPPWASRFTSMRPLAARTLCECVPGGTSIDASCRGLAGSLTSTTVVPCGAFMCAMKATRPSTTTCPPPGQSKYPTCFTPLALAPLPLMSRLLPLAAASSLASGRPQVASPFSGRGDGRANGPGDQPEKLQHPPEIRPAELDEGVAHAQALVLAELIDDGLLALGEKLVAQAEAHRDLERLPRAAVRVGRLAEPGEAVPKLGHASRRRVPAVAEGDDPPKRGRARAPDPDRGMGLLDGLRREAEVTEPEELALEARRVRRPQLLEDAQGLVGLATPGMERRAQDLELLLPPPHAEPTDETALRQRVEGPSHLWVRRGVVEGGARDPGRAVPYPGSPGRRGLARLQGAVDVGLAALRGRVLPVR